MKKALYLAPVVIRDNGLPMEYRIISCPIDKRTTFYKRYAAYICGDMPRTLAVIATHAADKNLIIKGNRLILANGAAAYSFARELGFPRASKLGF